MWQLKPSGWTGTQIFQFVIRNTEYNFKASARGFAIYPVNAGMEKTFYTRLGLWGVGARAEQHRDRGDEEPSSGSWVDGYVFQFFYWLGICAKRLHFATSVGKTLAKLITDINVKHLL